MFSVFCKICQDTNIAVENDTIVETNVPAVLEDLPELSAIKLFWKKCFRTRYAWICMTRFLIIHTYNINNYLFIGEWFKNFRSKTKTCSFWDTYKLTKKLVRCSLTKRGSSRRKINTVNTERISYHCANLLVCRAFFLFVHDLGIKRYKNLIKHYSQSIIKPRIHWCKKQGKVPKNINALSSEGIETLFSSLLTTSKSM